jgi:hypothetical protein
MSSPAVRRTPQLRSTTPVRAIAEAQQAGEISGRFAPVDPLALVLVIAAVWPALTPELTAEVRTYTQAHRRQVVTDAVSALIAT